MGTHPAMLRAAKHLDALGDRPFAAAQGDMGTHPAMLRAAKHLDALGDRPFAAAQGVRDASSTFGNRTVDY